MRLLIFNLLLVVLLSGTSQVFANETLPWWEFQSIETMKFSRDMAGQYLTYPEIMKSQVPEQIRLIAATGATHVAISTPYDEQFRPVLDYWVRQARENNLKIWFRGNWSSWEGWFGYERNLTRQEHLDQTVAFIRANGYLFENGDIFTACPECENGAAGDPRLNGDPQGHRQFLIDQFKNTNQAFREIGRNVRTNFHSMNADVARLIMDKDTTRELGGIVVIDHYVLSPEKLNQDITDIAINSGGHIVLGEFGAPIPDIHGPLDQEEQAEWMKEALTLLAVNPNLIGVNYWTNVGGSTALWNNDLTPRPVVAVVTDFFNPKVVSGKVVDQKGRPVEFARINSSLRQTRSNKDGFFTLALLESESVINVERKNYQPTQVNITDHKDELNVQLQRIYTSWWQRLLSFFSLI